MTPRSSRPDESSGARSAVPREQVVAFRMARHHLGARVATAAEAAGVGLQDTPPGAAALALAARSDAPLDGLVIVPSVRGAPLAVAPEDLAVFTAGLAPPDEEAARTLVGTATRALDGRPVLPALDAVSEAVRDALAAGPLPRDAFHQALRERLPAELLWWCKGCGSHHVHPSLWRATGVRSVLAITGREGRSAVFGAPPAAPPLPDPGAELARRFLRAYGPATPKLLAAWAGISAAHARALWERAGALAAVDGAWVLEEDRDVVENAPAAEGARLLPNLDPLLAARDREVLVPDAAVRKRIFVALGGPGVALLDGRPAALWRPAKQGKRLVVTLEPLDAAAPAAADALAAEAERLAPLRGATRAELAWTG